MSNKDRVFVAISTHATGAQSELSSLSSNNKLKTTPSQYHWSIWIEPKRAPDTGTSFALADSLPHASVANPFGWRLEVNHHAAPPPRMLGRIMIGKVPEDVSRESIEEALREVPLPCDPGSRVSDGADWIQGALDVLQGCGAAETFSIEAFMADAMGSAAQWTSKKNNGDVQKINYTWSRTFP
jgi:hypothetical protein